MPLSVAQSGIWVAQMLDPQSSAYNISEYVEILGPVYPELFCRAADIVVKETDALHLRIVDTQDGPRQYIGDREWVMPFFDVSGESDPDAAAAAWMEDEVRHVVDLARGPIFRVALLQVAEDRYFVFVRSHHICNDGFGGSVFIQRLAQVYSSLAAGEAVEIGNTGSWFDLLEYDEEYRKSAKYSVDREYWLEYLRGRPEPVTLSGKSPGRPSGLIRTKCSIPRTQMDALQNVAETYGASLPQALTAAAGYYVYKLTGERDVILGIPVTARGNAKMRRIVGMAANVLPLRIIIEPSMSVGDLLKETARGLRELFRHQRYRREDLRQDLGLGADQPELYGTVVNINSFGYELSFAGHPIRLHHIGNRPVNDLQIVVFDSRDRSEVGIEFVGKPSHYTEAELNLHMQRFVQLIDSIIERPTLPLCSLDILEPSERHALIEGHNCTDRAVRESTLVELFEESALRDPQSVALIGKSLRGVGGECETLTYDALNERANQLAHALIGRGVTPGSRVGLCMERSTQMVAAMLAVVKTGAAYVPMEPSYPSARIEFICRDTQTTLLLTQSAVVAGLPDLSEHCICLDEADFSGLPTSNPGVTIDPDFLAYIIFTSGSTGTPKGVALQHRPVVNLIDWVNRTYRVGAADRLLFVTSPCFDLSVYDVFGSFAAGASVYIASSEELEDPEALIEIVRTSGITFWDSAPAFLQQLVPYLNVVYAEARLRLVFVSGDWIPLSLPDNLRRAFPGVQVVGLGGATEAAIWSNSFDVAQVLPEWNSIPYGLPIQNSRYYILDQDLLPSPFGVAGDLYIGGECLAFGYYNRPRTTAERFVPDPYSQKPGAVLYATGDRARRMADGNIEFLGRVDHQVKIRGFRIETGEIEAALRSHPSVEHAAVIARDDGPAGRYLVAYIVAAADCAPVECDLRAHLGEQLPEYMMPSAFVVMDSLPLTANGKLDRQGLPAPERQGERYRAPRTSEEEVLCRLYAELLSVERVGIDDNFFALGGDSIVSILLLSKARSEGIEFSLRDIFQLQTIEALAGAARRSAPVTRYDDPEAAIGEISPTPIMRWYLNRGGRIDGFNQSIILHAPEGVGDITEARLVFSLQALLDRHDMLRLGLTQTANGAWELHIAPKGTVPAADLVRTVDITNLDGDTRRDCIQSAARQAIDALDPKAGRILQAVLLIEGNSCDLLIAIHHLAVDSVSWRILVPDFAAAWNSFAPDQQAEGVSAMALPNGTSFRSWAARLDDYALSEAVLAEMPIWESILHTGGELFPSAQLDVEREFLAKAFDR